jgi:hypothetical protein
VDRLELGAEPHLDFAFEHVEGVGVVEVDVRVRAFLAGRIAEPRDDDLVEIGQDAEGLLRPVGDGLAFPGR